MADLKYSHELLEKAKQLRNDGYHYFKIAELINQEFGSSITMSGINHALNDYMRGIYRFQKPKKQKQAQLKAKAGNDFDAGFDTDKRTGKPFAFGQGQLADFYKWQDKTPEDIMRFVGVDPDEWEIEMFSGGQHEVVSKDSDNQPQVTPAYSFKFRAKPKTADDLSIDDLISLFNERITPVKLVKQIDNGTKNLLVCIDDIHMGITKLEDIKSQLDEILGLIMQGWKEIHIIQLNDILHSDSIAQSRTTRGTELDPIDFQKAVRDAEGFLFPIIEASYKYSKEMHYYQVRANHDATTGWMLSEMIRTRYPYMNIEVEDQYRKAFKIGKSIGTMALHGHEGKTRASMLMATEYPELWASSTYRMVIYGHYHSEVVKDDYGVVEHQLGTLKPADPYESKKGYTMSTHKMQCMVFDDETLKAIRYI
ncbi:hypothetical protein [Oenococcus sicerae]|uniref:hypothetical protein n=1 Tax=Oenococcus sicerae TaxID=2203724 RepID=UPI0039E93B26